MKLLIIGDSHGNITNLKHVMGFAEKIGITSLVHTGDWNNIQAVNVVFSKEYGVKNFAVVVGNADINEDMQKLKQNNSKAFKESIETDIDGRKVYIVHKFKKDDKIYLGKDIVFTGHYHSQKEWELGGVKIVRPGALEKSINFAVYDTQTNKVEFFHEDN